MTISTWQDLIGVKICENVWQGSQQIVSKTSQENCNLGL